MGNSEYTEKSRKDFQGDVKSFVEGPWAFPFENPSATVYFMLKTKLTYWNPNKFMVKERLCEMSVECV